MIVYHATRTTEALKAIMDSGFIDGGGTYGTLTWHEGVWLSDRRLIAAEGGLSGFEPMVQLDIPEHVLPEYEWASEPFVGYREWLVPASVVNRYGPPIYVEDEWVLTRRMIPSPRWMPGRYSDYSMRFTTAVFSRTTSKPSGGPLLRSSLLSRRPRRTMAMGTTDPGGSPTVPGTPRGTPTLR